MTNPQRFINRMIIFLVLAVIVVAVLHEVVLRSFMYNPALNGMIIFVLLFGIGYCIRRVAQLKPEMRWIQAYRTNQPGFSLQQAPRLLSPVASMLGEESRRKRSHLSAMSVRYMLDSISARLDESRDISRYQIGLLIFLGLLGTFWGLLETIGSVGQVISGMTIGEGDLVVIFDELKDGLAAPISGMGTAFSSSLFGLSGSLVLGFLDLQANQAQNSFYNEMEEWLSSQTRLAGTGGGAELEGMGGPPVPAYIQALLERTAENLEQLESVVARGEDSRMAANASLVELNERLAQLADQMSMEQKLITRLVTSHEETRPVLARLGEGQAFTLDEATRTHLRNMDVHLARLLEETTSGRAQMVQDLRSELKLVSRTIAIAAGEPRAHQE
jgi:hypothetical protein